LTIFPILNIPQLFFTEGVEPIEQGRSIADSAFQGSVAAMTEGNRVTEEV
jgi:hypothetical protein